MTTKTKGVSGIKSKEYELEGTYEGGFVGKRSKPQTVAKVSPEERNLNYFRAPMFTAYRHVIVQILTEEPIPILLNSSSLDLTDGLVGILMENFKDYELVEDDLLDYIEEYLSSTDLEASQDYRSFSTAIADFIDPDEEKRVWKIVKEFLKEWEHPVGLDDPELVLEIVGFLKEKLESGASLAESLEEVLSTYQRYGKAGFPFMLSTLTGTAMLYYKRSDYSKIVKRGIREKYPCKKNGCGGMESISYMFEVRSSDEGKTEIKTCAKCGAKR
jgi:hypothetical protein